MHKFNSVERRDEMNQRLPNSAPNGVKYLPSLYEDLPSKLLEHSVVVPCIVTSYVADLWDIIGLTTLQQYILYFVWDSCTRHNLH